MTEAEEQKEIVAWFRATYPDYAVCLRVSQWGDARGRSRKTAAIRRAKARGQGAVDGESDMAILLKRGEFGSLLIEHKSAGQAHKASEAQLEYIRRHNALGNCAIVTRGVEAAKAAIAQYMALETSGPLLSQET